MAKTEDIEAKLAAFVDGAIDEAGRAEIEKHLASNPHHRELLADLSKQRDLLGALPRDMAPADVAETINSQLERAVLLGDVDSGSEIAGSIGRWSQLRAIAAMLLLTGGLAGIIYYLLPSPNHRPNEIADWRIQASPTTFPGRVELALGDTKDISAPVDTTIPTAPQAPVIPSAPPQTVVASPQIAMADDSPRSRGFDQAMASNAISPRQEIFSDVVQSRLSQSNTQSAPDSSSSMYLISKGDPESTGRNLREYFRSKNITTWESQSSEPMPPPLDASQQQGALATRMQQQQVVQMKMGGSATEPSQVAQQKSEPAPVVAANAFEGRIVVKQVTREQAAALRTWLDQRQSRSQRDSQEQVASTAVLAPPTTAPDVFAKFSTETKPTPSAEPMPALPVAATPTTEPAGPTSMPYAAAADLNGIIDLSPSRLDAPGIELKSRVPERLPENTLAAQPAPATQPQVQISTAGLVAPTTQMELSSVNSVADRIDVVIVLEPPAPTTNPATTEPSVQLVPASDQK